MRQSFTISTCNSRASSFRLPGDDLKTMVEKLKRAGVKILLPPYAADAIANGEETGGKVLTA